MLKIMLTYCINAYPQVGLVYLAPPPEHPTIRPVATGFWIE